jgi:hypothetical protein
MITLVLLGHDAHLKVRGIDLKQQLLLPSEFVKRESNNRTFIPVRINENLEIVDDSRDGRRKINTSLLSLRTRSHRKGDRRSVPTNMTIIRN